MSGAPAAGAPAEWDPRRAVSAAGLLAIFNAAGVLDAGDVHVASRLGARCGERDEAVLLACALAVRAPRLGHVCIDLERVAQTVTVDADRPVRIAELPWPEPGDWRARMASSVLVRPGRPDDIAPLRLDGSLLYLRRCLADEERVARDVIDRATAVHAPADEAALRESLTRLFPDAGDELQRAAAERVARGRFTVISGGPGTGKTTAVARALAVVCEQARAHGSAMPTIAVTAPTGKAAERLGEAIAAQIGGLAIDEEVRGALARLEGTTLHRLLGVRPDGVDHGRDAPLPHDVVVVDEASMVSLALMARLVGALRDDARLVLVGDAGQLASVEAGAVLGDIVGPAADGPVPGPLGASIVVLHHVHRFGPDIGALAAAVRAGDHDLVIRLLTAGGPQVDWISAGAARRDDGALHRAVVAAGRAVQTAAAGGDAPGALAAMGEFRVLCAHRRGPAGVAAWTALIERWLGDVVDGYAPQQEWYTGRPVLVTENDYGMGLFNGDSGVVVLGDGGRPAVAFARGPQIVEVSPYRLGTVETVHAMTIHKSQGSQFATVAVIVPDAASQLLTRELLYTAITRARTGLLLVGTEAAIRDAVRRPIARASGLRARLWGEPAG